MVTPSVNTNDDERMMRERCPTAFNQGELLQLLAVIREERQAWIVAKSPSITEVMKRYPRLFDVNKAIEEEFNALTTMTQPLRDQWRRVRDAVLDEAAKQGQTNTDLKAMVQFPDYFDEGKKTETSYMVLPYLLRMPAVRKAKRPRLTPGAVLNQFIAKFEEAIGVDDAVAELTDKGITQPMLIECQRSYWVKADNSAIPITESSCLDDCVEFLFMTYYVFNVEYPHDLKLVFGLFKRLLGMKPTLGKSVMLNDFVRKLGL